MENGKKKKKGGVGKKKSASTIGATVEETSIFQDSPLFHYPAFCVHEKEH